MLSGGIVCLHDDGWFYDLDWFVTLLWLLVFYLQLLQILIWVFILDLPHPYYLSFFSTWSNKGLQKKKLKLAPIPTRKCYYHHRHFKVSKLKKRRPHSTFFPTLCFLLSHLAHSNEDPNDQERRILKILHPDHRRGWPPTYLSSNILVYLLSPCLFFLRISRWDSV
jgi:hypothetical protein